MALARTLFPRRYAMEAAGSQVAFRSHWLRLLVIKLSLCLANDYDIPVQGLAS